MTKLANIARSFVREEEGATMVEYALLVALIGVALIASWGTLKTAIGGSITKSNTALDGAG
jgi:pilus assembly protein Flp/PilA